MKKRNCEYCQKEFTVYKTNPQKIYCSGECWCKAHSLSEEQMKHFMGGHKNIRRKKKK